MKVSILIFYLTVIFGSVFCYKIYSKKDLIKPLADDRKHVTSYFNVTPLERSLSRYKRFSLSFFSICDISLPNMPNIFSVDTLHGIADSFYNLYNYTLSSFYNYKISSLIPFNISDILFLNTSKILSENGLITNVKKSLCKFFEPVLLFFKGLYKIVRKVQDKQFSTELMAAIIEIFEIINKLLTMFVCINKKQF